MLHRVALQNFFILFMCCSSKSKDVTRHFKEMEYFYMWSILPLLNFEVSDHDICFVYVVGFPIPLCLICRSPHVCIIFVHSTGWIIFQHLLSLFQPKSSTIKLIIMPQFPFFILFTITSLFVPCMSCNITSHYSMSHWWVSIFPRDVKYQSKFDNFVNCINSPISYLLFHCFQCTISTFIFPLPLSSCDIEGALWKNINTSDFCCSC